MNKFKARFFIGDITFCDTIKIIPPIGSIMNFEDIEDECGNVSNYLDHKVIGYTFWNKCDVDIEIILSNHTEYIDNE